jgi:hypothetical protein
MLSASSAGQNNALINYTWRGTSPKKNNEVTVPFQITTTGIIKGTPASGFRGTSLQNGRTGAKQLPPINSTDTVIGNNSNIAQAVKRVT